MPNSNHIYPLVAATFDISSASGSWQKIGNSFGRCVSFIRIVNNSNKDVSISFDGNNLHDIVQTTAVLELNFSGNNFCSYFANTTQLYIKAAKGSGIIYLSCYCLLNG